MVRLGQLLHQQRLKKKLTLDDVEKATKIKSSFLASIERGEYHRLPSPAYAKGFVLNYATFLGISRAEAIALFRREFDEKKSYKVLPDSFAKKKIAPRFRIKVRESIFLIGGLLVLFLFFLIFQYRSAFFAPALTVNSPKDNAIVSQDVLVTGRTDSDATVTVNNEQTSVGDNGDFSKKISLFPGPSEIVIKAKNRFGKETVVKREVVIK